MNNQVTHGEPPVRRLQHVLTQSVLLYSTQGEKSVFDAFLDMTLPGPFHLFVHLFIFPPIPREYGLKIVSKNHIRFCLLVFYIISKWQGLISKISVGN